MKPSKLEGELFRLLSANLVPFIKGSPGIGKSAIVRAVADKLKLKVIDLRLGQCDPTDLLGFPNIEDGRSVYHPPKDIPVIGDKIPDGYDGWLLFLDEMNTAPKATQAAAYKLLDRMIGQTSLHPNVAIVAAGNLSTDGAIVTQMSSATMSRIVHIKLDASFPEWEQWALKTGVDYRILGFLNFAKENFHKFDPKNLVETFPCPRTWDFTDRVSRGQQLSITDDLETISGIIGSGAARAFIEYCAIYSEVKTLAEILAQPETIEISSRPDIRYAYASYIASCITPQNGDQLMKFVERLPIEFQIVSLGQAVKAKPQLVLIPRVQDWLERYAADSGQGML